MDDSALPLDPIRLLDAADAVLEAVVEVARGSDGGYVHPPALMGTDLQPECLCDFTLFEVREATSFLTRLGVLPRQEEH